MRIFVRTRAEDDATATITVYSPRGYVLKLGHRAGTLLGSVIAFLGEEAVQGTIRTAAGDPTNSCAPGAHDAVWEIGLTLAGRSYRVPIYVDRLSGGAEAAHGCQHGRCLLAAHHRDPGVGPHPQEARVVGAPAHAVVAGAEGAADDHRQLRHARAGDAALLVKLVAGELVADDGVEADLLELRRLDVEGRDHQLARTRVAHRVRDRVEAELDKQHRDEGVRQILEAMSQSALSSGSVERWIGEHGGRVAAAAAAEGLVGAALAFAASPQGRDLFLSHRDSDRFFAACVEAPKPVRVPTTGNARRVLQGPRAAPLASPARSRPAVRLSTLAKMASPPQHEYPNPAPPTQSNPSSRAGIDSWQWPIRSRCTRTPSV